MKIEKDILLEKEFNELININLVMAIIEAKKNVPFFLRPFIHINKKTFLAGVSCGMDIMMKKHSEKNDSGKVEE